MRRNWTRIAIVAVATIGVWQVASGTYIHAKAWLAQQLIASAWTRTLEGEREVKPWPSGGYLANRALASDRQGRRSVRAR